MTLVEDIEEADIPLESFPDSQVIIGFEVIKELKYINKNLYKLKLNLRQVQLMERSRESHSNLFKFKTWIRLQYSKVKRFFF